jgi:4-hydroxybenzoate polyprenyltransferase
LKVVAMVMLIGASVWLNRAKAKSNLLLQGGLLTTIFLFMTPGYGTQYLIWLVPFVAAIGLRATALYYLTSGVIVVREYACVAFALCSAPVLGVLLGLICWLSLLAVLQTYRRQLKAPEH